MLSWRQNVSLLRLLWLAAIVMIILRCSTISFVD